MSEAQRELLQAELMAPATASEGRVREVRFYSGAIVPRYDWFKDEEYELQFSLDPKDVKLDRLNAGAPVFKDHAAYLDNTVGITSNARIEGKAAFATLKFSEREELDGMWQDIQAGIINSVSMGVAIETLEDVTPKKKGALRRVLARGWQPFEISLVPIGADPKARFLAAQFMSDRHFEMAARGDRNRPMGRDSLVAIVDELQARLAARIDRAEQQQQEAEPGGEDVVAPPAKVVTAAALARYRMALARHQHTAGAHTERRI